jgi:hypothetical protein
LLTDHYRAGKLLPAFKYYIPIPKMENKTKLLNAAVLVASLGYFVDIYDLLLFSIVRVPSLRSLGLSRTGYYG